MKIKVTLTIGYPTADHKDELEIPDEELEGLTDNEKDKVYEQYTQEWANNYIEAWWEEVE